MSDPETVDTITLGAGGGAYPAGFLLARSGRRVVMVDPKGVMSGNCLAEGCVPSKAVREISELRRRAKLAHFAKAIGGAPPQASDYTAVVAHKDQVQETRYQQHDHELSEFKGLLSLVKGTARIVDPHTVEVATEEGTQSFAAEHVIVATGADVFVPPIPGADLCITSTDLFALHPKVTSMPERLAIIGGGYIGLEVACMMHSLGTEVVVLEALDQLLAGMDPGFVDLLARGLDPGIDIRLSAEVLSIERSGSSLKVSYSKDGTTQALEADQVLMAVGRRPVIPEGAKEVGLTLEGHGLAVKTSMQTPAHGHIYAPGDVNGRSMLFHSAVRQSLVAAHNILAGDRAVDYMSFEAVPTTIFTSPEGSYVGLTRSMAEERSLDILEGSYQLADDSRAQILGEPYGEIRLFFDAQSLRLLGGWVVGIDAGQLVGEIGQAVAAGLTAYDLARFADQHPMAAEGIGKAARAVAN